jgi:hypothetical protein
MEKKTTTSSAEEIDLLYFFRPVNNAFKKATAWGVDYVKLLAHNRFLFAGILALGAFAGYCLRYVIEPSYRTNAIFVSDMLPSNYCVSLIDNLNALRSPGNIPTLAKELNITEEAARQIKAIEPTALATDTFTIERRDTTLAMFQVTLVLDDISNVMEIQKGLSNYLESNEFVRKRKAEMAKSYQTQIEALELRRQSLDSLRTIVNNSITPRSQGQGIILGEPLNPVLIYQAEMAYLRERLFLEEKLATIDHVEVLQPFFKLNDRNNPDYDKLMNYAFIASFLFAMVVVPLIGRRLHGPRPNRAV